MITPIKNFLFVSLLALVFFLGYGVSYVKAECQIVAGETKFRPTAILNEFDDAPEQRPNVYLDVKTTGCAASTGTILEVKFFSSNIQQGTSGGSPTVTPIQIQRSLIYMAGAFSTLNPGHVSWSDSFTIPIKLGEQGNMGSCVGNQINASPNFWLGLLSPFAVLGNYLWDQTSGDASIYDCQLYAKISQAIPTSTVPSPPASAYTLLHSVGGPDDPRLLYECDVSCTDSTWIIGGESCFGTNSTNTNDLLDYGAVCTLDNGLINNVTVIGGDSVSGSTADYSTEALAPLPGFANDPDLSGFLKSLFTILIVIAGILALIMIVVGGITYMTSDAFGKKTDGKAYIVNALSGLVLALGAWIILNTINPQLASDLSIMIPNVGMIADFEPEESVGEGITQITLNVSSGGTTNMTACDTTKITQVSAFGKTFQIHQGLVSNIQAIDALWQAMPADSRYKVKSIGGYNCRKVRGTNKWSSHAFGTAVDINPTKNPFGSTLVTDMPENFRSLWTSHGWGWGGAWTSKKDAMHYSKYPQSEGGDGIIN